MTHNLDEGGVLSGIRIVELGASRAVQLTGMLLAKYGARVDFFPGNEHDSKNILHIGKNRILAPAGKIESSFLHDLLSKSDCVIHDHSKSNLTEKGFDFLKIRSQVNPRLIECALPGYPGADSRSGAAWCEESVSAEAGVYENPTGFGKPYFYPIPVASTAAALHAATAVVMALIARKRDGAGQYIEIPIHKVALSIQILGMVINSSPPTEWELVQWLVSPFMGIWKTKDQRHIFVHLALPKHLRSFLRMIEKNGFAAEASILKKRIHKTTRNDPTLVHSPKEAKDVIRIFKALFLKNDASFWEELFGAAELCCAKVRSPEEWFSHPQPLESKEIGTFTDSSNVTLLCAGSLLNSQHSLESAHQERQNGNPAAPLRAPHNEPSGNDQKEKTAGTPKHPLQGIKVLDFSRVIAGPYAGKILAEYGAEVIQMTFRKGHLKWEEPFYIAFSSGKKSVYVDLSTPENKNAFHSLLSVFKPDIVIHNFSHGSVKKLGIDYASFKQINPSVTYLQIGAYNGNGPWKNRVGFEQNIQAATGVQALFSGLSTPRLLPMPINDICTGQLTALGAALAFYQSLTAGKGNSVQVFLSASSLLLQLEYLNRPSHADSQSSALSAYFQARDGMLFMHVKQPYAQNLAKIPLFSQLNGMHRNLHPEYLKRVIKELTFETFQSLIAQARCTETVFVVRRKRIKQLLREELNKRDGLFEKKYFAGFGKTIFSHSPVCFQRTPLKSVDSAPFIGSNTAEVFSTYSIPINFSSPAQPVNKKESIISSFVKRVLWVLRQLKWIGVLRHKERR